MKNKHEWNILAGPRGSSKKCCDFWQCPQGIWGYVWCRCYLFVCEVNLCVDVGLAADSGWHMNMITHAARAFVHGGPYLMCRTSMIILYWGFGRGDRRMPGCTVTHGNRSQSACSNDGTFRAVAA